MNAEDADKLRKEINLITREKRDEVADRLRNGRKDTPGEGPGARPRSMFFLGDLFREDKREQLANRLVSKLSPSEQAYWQSLEGPRKRGQLWLWIQEAMKLKADPKQLEEFFASDNLTLELRQKLLDMPYTNMQAALERMYIRSQLGAENPGQLLFDDFGERGRGPWGGPGMGPPREGPGPPGFGPDGPPNDRRPRRPPPSDNRPT